MIQIYGQFHDYASFSNVSRGLAYAMRVKHVQGLVYAIGTLNPEYKDHYLPVGMNNMATAGIYVGYPESAPAWLKGHSHKIVMTVCETDRIPQTWVDSCNEVDLVTVPSQWCYDAFKRSGVKKPIEIVPHGVWFDNLRKARAPAADAPLTFMHISGSLSFASRKGTNALLLAFRKFLTTHPESRLVLRMPETPGVVRVVRQELGFTPEQVVIDGAPSIGPARMNRYFDDVHAVVQPSRAEGFGLVPLEARCAGVPVIATYCTGHEQHFALKTDIQVLHDRSEPLETQSNPLGSAPTVKVAEVLDALQRFAENKDGHRLAAQEWADKHAAEWLWEKQLSSLMYRVKQYGRDKSIVLGANASLRGA